MQIRDQGASRHTHARARACTHSHRHAQAQARAHHNIRTLAAQTCAYPACARNHNARTQNPAARCRRVRADASAPGNSRQPQCEDSTRMPRAPLSPSLPPLTHSLGTSACKYQQEDPPAGVSGPQQLPHVRQRQRGVSALSYAAHVARAAARAFASARARGGASKERVEGKDGVRVEKGSMRCGNNPRLPPLFLELSPHLQPLLFSLYVPIYMSPFPLRAHAPLPRLPKNNFVYEGVLADPDPHPYPFVHASVSRILRVCVSSEYFHQLECLRAGTRVSRARVCVCVFPSACARASER